MEPSREAWEVKVLFLVWSPLWPWGSCLTAAAPILSILFVSWLLRLEVLFGERIVSACLWTGSQAMILTGVLKLFFDTPKIRFPDRRNSFYWWEVSSNIDVEVKGQAEKEQSCEAEPTGCHKWSFGKSYTSFTISAQAIQLVIRHCIKKKIPKQQTHTQNLKPKCPLFLVNCFLFFLYCTGEMNVLVSVTKKI